MSLVAQLVHTVRSHTSDVNGVSFSRGLLSTCAGDKTVRLWSVDDGFSELPCSPLCGHGYYVHCCTFSPWGSLLASCSTDGKLVLWNAKTGAREAVLRHPSKVCIRVCRFSPSSSFLATGSDDETLCLWEVATRKLLRSFAGHDGSVTSCAFSPDSKYIISGCTNGYLRLWDTRSIYHKCLTFEINGHDLGVSGCDFSSTYGTAGSLNSEKGCFLLASSGQDNLVKLWDVFVEDTTGTLHLRVTLTGHHAPVLSCCFAPHGKLLASSSIDKTVRLWDPLKGECVHIIEGHSRYITCCAFSLDASMLASGSNDKLVKVWKLLCINQLDSETDNTNVERLSSEQLSSDNAPMISWNVDKVCHWLVDIGLEQYQDNFQINAIDGLELLDLTQETLEKSVGITALGHRNKLLRARTEANEYPAIQVKEQGFKIPDEYLCPITREIMKDPVIAADGYTYERVAIQAWLAQENARSPMTNAVMAHVKLTPNRSLKMLIQHHL